MLMTLKVIGVVYCVLCISSVLHCTHGVTCVCMFGFLLLLLCHLFYLSNSWSWFLIFHSWGLVSFIWWMIFHGRNFAGYPNSSFTCFFTLFCHSNKVLQLLPDYMKNDLWIIGIWRYSPCCEIVLCFLESSTITSLTSSAMIPHVSTCSSHRYMGVYYPISSFHICCYGSELSCLFKPSIIAPMPSSTSTVMIQYVSTCLSCFLSQIPLYWLVWHDLALFVQVFHHCC